MTRSRPTIAVRCLAFAALASLLVVPGLHGSLSHEWLPLGAEAGAGAVLDAAPPGAPQLGAAERCPLCLAGGLARTPVPPRPCPVEAPSGGALCWSPPRPHAPAPVDLTRAAPRAPPSPA